MKNNDTQGTKEKQPTYGTVIVPIPLYWERVIGDLPSSKILFLNIGGDSRKKPLFWLSCFKFIHRSFMWCFWCLENIAMDVVYRHG